MKNSVKKYQLLIAYPISQQNAKKNAKLHLYDPATYK